jgi:hypothetical protein
MPSFVLIQSTCVKGYHCVRVSSFHSLLLLFFGAKGVSRNKTPIQNITLTGNIGSKYDGSLCNLVLPKPIQPQPRETPQRTCSQPLRDKQSARELPADSLTVSLCNLITHGPRDSTVCTKPRETPMDVQCTTAQLSALLKRYAMMIA